MKTASEWGAGLALAVVLQANAWAGAYEVHELTRDGFKSIWLNDVNNKGQMLGNGIDAFGQSYSFIYSNGSFTDLPTLQSQNWYTQFNSISDSGATVGSIWTFGETYGRKGVIYENGAFSTVLPEGAVTSELLSISLNGRYVTGWARNADDSFYHFALDRDSNSVSKVSSALISNFLRGINNSGVAVTKDRSGHSVLFDTIQGSFESITPWPGGNSTTLSDISNGGLLAGTGALIGNDGYLLKSTSFVGAKNQLSALDVPGFSWSSGVNDAGTVVGYSFATERGDRRGFYAVTSVPEPSEAALLTAGLLGLGALVRRRRANKTAQGQI